VRFVLGAAGLVLVFTAGVLVGQAHAPGQARASAGLWADYCGYNTRTEYFSGGSYTSVVAIVADWDSFTRRWQSVTRTAARKAVGDFDCEWLP
jgi:hypothetical protein